LSQREKEDQAEHDPKMFEVVIRHRCFVWR
jgi:hypothetical protein